MADFYSQFEPPPQAPTQPADAAPATSDFYGPVDTPAASPSVYWETAKEVGQTAQDALRAATNVFGVGDRFAAYMKSRTGIENLSDLYTPRTLSDVVTGKGASQTYDEALQDQLVKSQQARERSPTASVLGDLGGGAVATALTGPLGADALAAKVTSAVAPKVAAVVGPKVAGYVAPVVGRAVGYGTEGAGLGAVQGASQTYSGNLPDYVKNAVMGSAFGGATGAVLGPLLGGARPPVSKARVPTQDDLFAAKNAGYDALNQNGANYTPAGVAQHADAIESYLRGERFSPTNSQVSFNALDELRDPARLPLAPNGQIDPAAIDFVRKGLQHVPRDTPDEASSEIVKRGLDHFIAQPPAGSVVRGTEQQASQASWLADWARGNYGGLKRLEAYNNLVDNARTGAGAQNSGLNIENKLRQGVASFVRKDVNSNSGASRAGFNPDEIDTLRKFATGEEAPGGANLLRAAGNVLAGGAGTALPVISAIGSQAATSLGVDPKKSWGTGAATAALGLTLRAMANRRAVGRMAEINDMIASRNPLYQQRAAVSGMTAGSNPAGITRNAIVNAIVRQQTAE